ncbi:carboxymuconolactone decarboxylase family protein [Pseudothermotoga thermarum]|uniref:Alkylhydroperoxidase like protein, AhpD family n=1 Tax=Pseudothermotoga thermarum DSM 5069 TaxID=688269 RepID=F7YV73_9THEM|nr:carboxymuconolactone decarboxylase family protein [Pseudothermotoga thermarum]AEH50372.1 alkylhydroperoxidase like protein, AhpD family [Pseudothermotoga thermarum DSM 5069]
MIEEFVNYRERLNKLINEKGNLHTKRFFNLDSQVYADGALSAKTKEMLGLVASMVLRCNDCILYHLIRLVQLGATDDELFEAFNVALVVGGSIVIPHLRKAVEALEELREMERNGKTVSL